MGLALAPIDVGGSSYVSFSSAVFVVPSRCCWLARLRMADQASDDESLYGAPAVGRSRARKGAVDHDTDLYGR